MQPTARYAHGSRWRSRERRHQVGGVASCRHGRAVTAVVGVLAIAGVIHFLVPQLSALGPTVHRLRGADPKWLGLGVVLEALSLRGYIALFRTVFSCHGARIGWKASYQITMQSSSVPPCSCSPVTGARGAPPARARPPTGRWSSPLRPSVRREGRRREARAQLRASHEALPGIGAPAFTAGAARNRSGTRANYGRLAPVWSGGGGRLERRS
jgi:hypothetical protein